MMSTEAKVFGAVSVLYVLVLAAMVWLWRGDRFANVRGLERAHNEIRKLKVQLEGERALRQEMEGYYLLDDAANLDHEWRETMAYTMRQLESNDPSGGTT